MGGCFCKRWGAGGGDIILKDRVVETLQEGVSCAAPMEAHRETQQPICPPTSLPTAACVGDSNSLL